MNIPPCKGRERITNKDRKWYGVKGKSTDIYTCCEDCYIKFIKDTSKEESYFEIQNVINPNCDYFLYETNCNFEDCSFIKNNIRVSIIDNMGRRYKKNTIDDIIYMTNDNKTYAIIIENLLVNDELSKLSLESCSINDQLVDFSLDTNILFSIIELNIDDGFINNNEYDNIYLSVNQYIKHDFCPITELPQNNSGMIYSTTGIPLLQIINKPNEKTKAILGIDVYKCDNNKIIDFHLTVTNKNVDEIDEIDEIIISI